MDYKKDLKNKLPELKKIEGFPIGSDEDILALSDPPYYTACPNPYISDFIKEYGKPYDEATDDYHREPFTEDIDTNKNDKLTNAHSYHTKSPFHAIQQNIEHYTLPGDLILDCFTGSGMSGVAAQRSKRKSILIFAPQFLQIKGSFIFFSSLSTEYSQRLKPTLQIGHSKFSEKIMLLIVP